MAVVTCESLPHYVLLDPPPFVLLHLLTVNDKTARVMKLFA